MYKAKPITTKKKLAHLLTFSSQSNGSCTSCAMLLLRAYGAFANGGWSYVFLIAAPYLLLYECLSAES